MKRFFDFFTRLSLRFRYVTLVMIVVTMGLGIYAGANLQQELIPPVEFPQTYIFAQASGLNSNQVLHVLTERIESALQKDIPEIVNINSTTASFGAFITASNDFGLNQDRLINDIISSLDGVWLPSRTIGTVNSDNQETFVNTLLGDISPEFLLYIAAQNPNFLFQLNSEIWENLSEDSLQAASAYLAQQIGNSGEKTALEILVEQEIVPQLRSLDLIANVDISGGQSLPDEAIQSESAEQRKTSQLLQLSPEIWQIVKSKLGYEGELDDEAVAHFSETAVIIPETAPTLPASWLAPHFNDVDDILEIANGQSASSIFNDFATNGVIKGALGKTDDLTVETFLNYLALDPSLINAFEAEHLTALPEDVSALIFDKESRPADIDETVSEALDLYVENLDGFTRDALTAESLASSITGQEREIVPVNLPGSWRIQPPRIITFSFADLPLATFSVIVKDQIELEQATESEVSTVETEAVVQQPDEPTTSNAFEDAPEGPALPQIFSIMGAIFNTELNTADDLLSIQLPAEMSTSGNGETIDAAGFFNTLLLFNQLGAAQAGGDTQGTPGLEGFDIQQALPALQECGIGLLDLSSPNFDFAKAIIGCVPVDVVEYLVKTDPTFLANLQDAVFNSFSEDVFAIEGISPPLASEWDTLASQSQFENSALQYADDLLAFGDGSASQVLNTIESSVPEKFAGYEVRLFNSFTPQILQYFVNQEPDFFNLLDPNIILKFSSETLAALPESAFVSLDTDQLAKVQAIITEEAPSAAEALASLYTSDVPPADPSAPALNPEWNFVAQFIGIELNTAYDFFRFNEFIGTPAEFINGLFNTAQGSAFAEGLLGGLSQEAFVFIASNDVNFINSLEPRALLLLSEEVFNSLAPEVQERALAGEVFKPSALITRTNGASSLLLTVYKPADANTVDAYYEALEVINRIDAENEHIDIGIAFEQSSFIEDSIEGVIREGSLGAVFAIIIILIFLSGGFWSLKQRRTAGIVTIIVFAVAIVLAGVSNLAASNNDIMNAFNMIEPVTKVLLVLGFITGILIILYPRQMPYPAWRSTLVIAVSIPLSILAAVAMMYWLPAFMNRLLGDPADASPIVAFILRLFPASLTLNIMTLSGLTVAVGRVVDDSIVVLENIFRQMQGGMDKKEAIITGARDVSAAIFSATLIAVVVFLPLGLTGGLVGEFFLPFGLALTYALLASFVVAITVIPVLAYFFITVEDIPEESETTIQKVYHPILNLALKNWMSVVVVLVIAFASLVIALGLFAQRPLAFIPNLGEIQISVAVNLEPGTSILDTNTKVEAFEDALNTTIPAELLSNVRTVIGGGGLSLSSLLGGGNSIEENKANIEIKLDASEEQINEYTALIRAQAEGIFGEEAVSVSAGSISSGGFGGLELVVSGADQDVLEQYDSQIIAAINSVEGIANASSNVSQSEDASSDESTTLVRINGTPALSYTAELETNDSIGVVQKAIDAIEDLDLQDGIKVSQGFNSEIQTQGFAGMFVAMGIAMVIVVIILIVVFKSPVYWIALMVSVAVAPFGAAIALTIADMPLGISAMIGLLMLIGLAVTNAVVLIDRVGANREERHMSVKDAILEGGNRRVRPIIMTAFATIIGLVPLAIGLSDGAIIASEMGVVVIGGVISSTLLTLIVVPALYYVLTPLHDALVGIFSRGNKK
ncbi:hypothetical protein MASR2M15_12340 [Anaerolineales bacterium]